METSYIVTFIGDDRPGLVEALAAVIEQSGGNWLESRLSQLGGKFAGLVLVSLPSGDGDALQMKLKALVSHGLSVRVTPATTGKAIATPKLLTLTVIGPDRPGIVREISRALAAHGVNVIEMDSGVSSAPMSGEQLFEACIEVEVPGDSDTEQLSDNLDEIANQMTLDITLENG